MDISMLGEALDTYVPEIMEHCGTPGLSIAVGVGTEVPLARAYGVADLATGRPMAVDTVAPTGSDCKPYTGVAALQLVERGVIGLDEPIEPYVRVVNPYGQRPITLRDLLTHRSGLGVGMGNFDRVPPPPLGEHLRRVLDAGRSDAYGGAMVPFWAGPVGAAYQYSNVGIAVVGHLVELLNPDGVTFSEWVGRQVFAPLGMGSTVFPRAQHPDFVPAELLARRSTGYATLPGLRLPLPTLYPGDYPAGSALSTPSDHARFVLAVLGGGAPVLSAELATQLVTAQASGGTLMGARGDLAVGLVFNVFGGAHPYIGHGGEYPWGWTHFTRGWIEDRVALVISANQFDLGDFGLSDRPGHAAARLVAEIVTAWVHGVDPRPRRTLAAGRSFLAGLLVGDRLTARLGISGQPAAEELARVCAEAEVAFPWDQEAFLEGVGRVRLTAAPLVDHALTVRREVAGHELALLAGQLGVPGLAAQLAGGPGSQADGGSRADGGPQVSSGSQAGSGSQAAEQ
ncbi:serine hydrolase domain-containing protein [Nonomuraea gerenzanensis]|uniref:Beta-lactamase class C and other penicillin binding proteins n=1 Tax=Nonomuraea gerenzanensis TaxID=93944 RepID=A0A1M4EQX3_9ACTN|nr:serine hydrolase domain-containing protein [Nonomuraea gerenzanensis]UBU12673.1 beta-lactamase family protein [Nonomuraea gerenzanensis]SBP01230.1 Beta-lactamase class C and other penicillin binding proteins [Nonomuraea gerenzanensis]